MSVDERDELAAACATGRTVAAGEQILAAGDRPDDLFLLLDGWATRSNEAATGGRQITAILLPGEVCNLDAVLIERAASDVRMVTQGRVAALPVGRACELGRDHPSIGRTYLWLALREQRRLDRTILSLGRQSARQRVAHLLCGLADRLGLSDFDFPLTQDQLADAVGVTNIHVCRVLGELRRDGLIATDNRRLALLEEQVLRTIGGFEPESRSRGLHRSAAAA